MTKQELLTKCDEALAACLDQVTARAKNQEGNGAKTFAEAAQTMQYIKRCVEEQPARWNAPEAKVAE